MGKQKLYTIGYTTFGIKSGIDIDKMFETLKNLGISYVVDVRSVPYSKRYPQCNSNNLKIEGQRFGVPYIHIPELGAKASPSQDVFSKASDILCEDVFPVAASKRPEKSELHNWDEIVDFKKFRNDALFIHGTKRIEHAYDKNFVLALMCSEKDPINCHRYFLISRSIEQMFGDRIEVEHIVKEDNETITTVPNKDMDKMLSNIILNRDEIKRLGLLENDLFSPEAKIDKYRGKTCQEKVNDFCDRYWNIMHGWKKNMTNNKTNVEDYD